ncbi:MAG: FecR domain-containing protein, partial [Psychrosphaera sp.]|nr:FecR domain-containing protein [Psychrosphaera sp.]
PPIYRLIKITLMHNDFNRVNLAADWYAKMQAQNPDKAGFAKWRLGAPEHAKAYQAYEQMWADSHALANDSDILAQLANIPSVEKTSRSRWYMPSAAAAVLLVSFITMFLIQNIPQVEDFSTGIAQQQIVQLDDGTIVTLDANTKIQVTMSSQGRDVQLFKGRARFDVAKDSQRPFVVSTNVGSVRAIGTIFDVNKTKHAFNVALLEGIVEVAAKSTKNKSQKELMSAGQKTTVSTSHGVAKPTKITQDLANGWTNGLLQFNATPLSQAVAEFNRYLKKPLRIRDKDIGQFQITGSFATKEPEKIIEALTIMFPLKAVPSKNVVLLVWDQTRQ